MSKEKPIQFKVTEEDHRALGALAADKDSSRSALAKNATLALLPKKAKARKK